MFASCSSAAISILQTQPNLLTTLQSNIALFRQQLIRLEPTSQTVASSSTNPSENVQQTNKDALIHIPSHPNSALIHIFLLNPPPTIEAEEMMLQEVVDECLNHSGVLITRARRLRGQETFEHEPSLKVFLSGAFNKKEVEKAGQALRSALVKVCGSK
jgi:serine palmitoyltransferase